METFSTTNQLKITKIPSGPTRYEEPSPETVTLRKRSLASRYEAVSYRTNKSSRLVL